MPTIKVQPAHQGLIIPFPKDFSEEFSEDIQASVEFKFNSADAERLTSIPLKKKTNSVVYFCKASGKPSNPLKFV